MRTILLAVVFILLVVIFGGDKVTTSIVEFEKLVIHHTNIEDFKIAWLVGFVMLIDLWKMIF